MDTEPNIHKLLEVFGQVDLLIEMALRPGAKIILGFAPEGMQFSIW